MDCYGQYVKAGGGVQEVRGALPFASKAREPRRPTGEPNISGDWAPEQVVMTDSARHGRRARAVEPVGADQARRAPWRRWRAQGRWSTGRSPPVWRHRADGTREQAAAKFVRDDNPRFRCETTSIVFDWTFDGPVNRITQNRDTIVVQYGQMDLRRTVHMNLKTHPANVKPSRAGHSIGRWEGDVLVVDTVGFEPGVLSAPVRHGAKLHVVERFTLDEKTMKLTRAYTAEDPDYLKGQSQGRTPSASRTRRSPRTTARIRRW